MSDTTTVPRAVLEQALEAFKAWDARGRLRVMAALSAALEQPDIEIPASVPEGWKLVPVEPTDDMLYDIQEYSHILPPRGRRIWAHMLAAAPQPPALEQSQPKREPIPNVMMDLGWELHGSNDPYQSWCMAVEWTERAHGIGGEA